MAEALERLINELRLLHNQVVQVGERLHEGEKVTLPMRAVLEFLSRNGPATVPDIARQRRVTRQHIQTIVNDLLEADLVGLAPNPRHQRSSLVALTHAGADTIGRMRKREQGFFEGTGLGVTEAELDSAARTMARVRDVLGGITV